MQKKTINISKKNQINKTEYKVSLSKTVHDLITTYQAYKQIEKLRLLAGLSKDPLYPVSKLLREFSQLSQVRQIFTSEKNMFSTLQVMSDKDKVLMILPELIIVEQDEKIFIVEKEVYYFLNPNMYEAAFKADLLEKVRIIREQNKNCISQYLQKSAEVNNEFFLPLEVIEKELFEKAFANSSMLKVKDINDHLGLHDVLTYSQEEVGSLILKDKNFQLVTYFSDAVIARITSLSKASQLTLLYLKPNDSRTYEIFLKKIKELSGFITIRKNKLEKIKALNYKNISIDEILNDVKIIQNDLVESQDWLKRAFDNFCNPMIIGVFDQHSEFDQKIRRGLQNMRTYIAENKFESMSKVQADNSKANIDPIKIVNMIMDFFNNTAEEKFPTIATEKQKDSLKQYFVNKEKQQSKTPLSDEYINALTEYIGRCLKNNFIQSEDLLQEKYFVFTPRLRRYLVTKILNNEIFSIESFVAKREVQVINEVLHKIDQEQIHRVQQFGFENREDFLYFYAAFQNKYSLGNSYRDNLNMQNELDNKYGLFNSFNPWEIIKAIFGWGEKGKKRKDLKERLAMAEHYFRDRVIKFSETENEIKRFSKVYKEIPVKNNASNNTTHTENIRVNSSGNISDQEKEFLQKIKQKMQQGNTKIIYYNFNPPFNIYADESLSDELGVIPAPVINQYQANLKKLDDLGAIKLGVKGKIWKVVLKE